MNADVWPEPGGEHLRQRLLLEGKQWNMLHQPPQTRGAWDAYRAELLAKILQQAGTFPDAAALNMEEHGILQCDGYRIIKVTYQSRPGLRLTGNLYIPDGDGLFPAILGTHGHWSQGKIAERVAARGHVFAKAGFVVLLVDAFGSGERCTVADEYEYHGATIGGSLMSIGETLLGMQVVDNMRGVDLLQSLPYVDGERIGVTGASGGGNQTMWLAALDDRIKAAVPVVSVGTFESYICNTNCICEVLPRGLTLTEEWAILAMAAPGALLILSAMRDTNCAFSVSEMMRSYERARQIYELLGIEDRIAYKAIDLPHGYWPEMFRHALGWFRYWLQEEGTGRPCAIFDIPIVPENDLCCFESGTRPANVKSIVGYVTEQGMKQKRDFLERIAAGQVSAAEKRATLKQLICLDEISGRARVGPIVSGQDDDRAIERFSVESAPGVLLPCLHVLPSGQCDAQHVVIAVHPDGKPAAVVDTSLEAQLRKGSSVCYADLRNIGETQWNPIQSGRIDHESARSALWLGRTMIGEWTEDLVALVKVFTDRGMTVELHAWGILAVAALTTAALTDSLSGVVANDLLATYVLNGRAQTGSMAAFVPGILSWGDVSLLAALATCPTTVNSLMAPTGAPLNENDMGLWHIEVQKIRSALIPLHLHDLAGGQDDL